MRGNLSQTVYGSNLRMFNAGSSVFVRYGSSSEVRLLTFEYTPIPFAPKIIGVGSNCMTFTLKCMTVETKCLPFVPENMHL